MVWVNLDGATHRQPAWWWYLVYLLAEAVAVEAAVVAVAVDLKHASSSDRQRQP
jgi:hypothetical protein